MAPSEDPRLREVGHRLFSHYFFPDVAILRVRDQNFMISASYLAIHSNYFYNLFYGPNSTGLNGRYELNLDPDVFADLVDMIYPCYKATNCIVDCLSSLVNRLELALKLDMRFAVKRLIDDSSQTKYLVHILQKNNAWQRYSHLFGQRQGHIVKRMKLERNNSHSLDPMPVTASFPDMTTVITRGMSMIVSATTLSLHSTLLAKMLYNKGRLVKGVKIDVDPRSFLTFLEMTGGLFPSYSDCTSKFLDDLIVLGAKDIYQYYLSGIKKKMTDLTSEDASRCAMQLLGHYSTQASPDMVGMRFAACFLSRDQLEKVLSNCPSLIPSVKDSLRVLVDGRTVKKSFPIFDRRSVKKPFQIFVRSISGRTLTFQCDKGASTTVFELMQMIERREGIPVDRQRLSTFRGKQLHSDRVRTLMGYDVTNESTILMN